MAGQKFVRVRRFAENAVYVGKKDRRDPHAARAAAQAFLQGGGDRRQDRFPQARAVQETVNWIGQILEQENNITCDNPLLFEGSDGQFEAVMGCNCSNTQVGYSMDLLSTVMAELGRGLLKQEAPAILWQRLATLAMQVSGDSIPTKGGQEDHVEFNYTAAEKAAESACVLAAMLARCSR